jgi:hypothetical protein
VVQALLAVSLALGVALFAEVATAAPRVSLSYSQGPRVNGCPPESRLREAVVSRLGEDPFEPAGARRFQVEIAAAGAGLEGRITLFDENGNVAGARRFEGSAGHCPELVAAMALAISLAINPDLVVNEDAPALDSADDDSEAVTTPPPHAGSDAPKSPRRDAASPVPMPARAATPPWSFALGAGVHGAVGTAPEPALGAMAFARARRGIASLALEARFDAPFDHDVGASGAGSVHASLWAGAVVPCVHFAWLRGCWVALAGDLAAGSRNVSEQRSPHGLFAATGPRAGVEWPLLETLSVSAQLDGLVTVQPVRIVLDGRQIWRSAPLSAALTIAAVWQIP